MCRSIKNVREDREAEKAQNFCVNIGDDVKNTSSVNPDKTLKKVRTAIQPVATLFCIVCLLLPVQAYEVLIDQHIDRSSRVANPSLTKLSNGSVLAVFTRFSGDWTLGIYGKLSNDPSLRVWSDPFLIRAMASDYQSYSCALCTIHDKTFLFYDHYVSWTWDAANNSCSVWMLETEDNAQTWINDRRIDSGNHNYTIGTYSICVTENGTIIFPISWFVEPTDVWTEGAWRPGMLRSDDEGLTWYEAGTVPDYPRSSTNLDEPCVVQLSNGSLYCLLRCNIKAEPRHVFALSNDLGLSWNEVRLVPEMFSIDTTPALFSYAPNLTLAMWVNRTATMTSTWDIVPRTPLVVALSRDDCCTWQNVTVVANHAMKEMNDMSFFCIDGKVVLCYRRYTYWYYGFPSDDSVIRVFEVGPDGLKEASPSFDFNQDGRVDVFDALILSRNLKTQNPLTDLNYDGVTDIYDAILFSEAFNQG